jgi:DNA-binding response OmpR family regulator
MKETARVLVIDDDKEILLVLQTILKFRNHEVFIKPDIENMEGHIREIGPDVILMDMLLSGEDGKKICRRIKSDPTINKIPLIMLSGYPQAQAACIEAGADYFLSKPFDMNSLLAVISEAINK